MLAPCYPILPGETARESALTSWNLLHARRSPKAFVCTPGAGVGERQNARISLERGAEPLYELVRLP